MALWGKIDNEASKPKYLSDTLRNNQTVTDKDATAGIDVSEATTAANRLKAIKTPGWTKYRTYTDANGSVRHKAEVLVAFGGDFTGGDSDTFPPNPVITISTQPLSTTVATGADAEFIALATATRDAVVTFQWQVSVDSGDVFANIEGATTATLVVTSADPEYVTGNQFRVVVSAVAAQDVVSDAATLTITV